MHYSDAHLDVHIGDCRTILRTLPAESVHCVVTSPPYWGLRDYGVAGALGLEPTPEAFIAAMVEVFREVKRVLRKDGTLWLNMGDSYASQGGPLTYDFNSILGGPSEVQDYQRSRTAPPGLKPKDLVGMPWRLAFALQADGWYLRSDIIWAKPNPMPESVTDRPTKSHEYVFLLTKAARYYYDAEAVREPAVVEKAWPAVGPASQAARRLVQSGGPTRVMEVNPAGRHLRSVWTIATEPYPGAHFATFPQKLVEPCIKAGTSERGVCPECGAPWVREVDVERTFESGSGRAGNLPVAKNGERLQGGGATIDVRRGPTLHTTTTGWRPSCGHGSKARELLGVDRHVPVPATVLDPFAGSGTTGLVANRLGRRAILIDLSADYIDQAMLRNQQHPLGLIGG